MIDISALEKIHSRYKPGNDLGPGAPVNWAVEDLAQLVGVLVKHIEELEARVPPAPSETFQEYKERPKK